MKRDPFFLPVLFGRDKAGSVMQWTISVHDHGDYSAIRTEHGKVGGKHIVHERTVHSGTNQGRSNATTHFTQAVQDATSRHRAKQEKHRYAETLGTESSSTTAASPPLPMLAQDYHKHAHKLAFPVYTQPKLDGYRALYFGGKLWSRTGKPFSDEVVRRVLDELAALQCSDVLDGELYNHGQPFESLGVLRKKTASAKDVAAMQGVKYHVYDVVREENTFRDRLATLESIAARCKTCSYVTIVPTTRCVDGDDVKTVHAANVGNGYEGTMVRGADGLYQCKFRSYGLQKYKDFMDAEFEIVGFDKENSGEVIWVCKAANGRTFSVQSKGLSADRRDIYARAHEYVGKALWVQYFELTGEGVPRFPKTMRPGLESIRDALL